MQIRIENFSGIIPKISPRLLPANNASKAVSTELYSGELRGLKQPAFIKFVGGNVWRAYTANIQKDDTSPYWDSSLAVGEYQREWVTFTSKYVDFYRGPVVNDEYQRHYWTGFDVQPRVVDGREIIEFGGDLSLCDVRLWGIPNPSSQPTISSAPAVNAGDPRETRAYTYTFINDWDEESAPAPPSDPVSGNAEGSWTVTGIQTTYGVAGDWKPLKAVRIYRTIAGFNSVSYRFVAEVPLASLTGPSNDTYTDAAPSSEVALNEPITSTYYAPPPSTALGDSYNLDGIVALPNGVFAGFAGSDVYFSEPYRPYAWPRTYTMSVGEKIVGLGVYHSGLIVCTSANPKVISGAHPENMTMVELDQAEPCLSRRSIVSSTDGVFYASQNGVVLVTEYDAAVISRPLISRTEWQTRYFPDKIQAAVNGQGYIAIYSAGQGTIIGPEVGNGAMVDIGNISYVRTLQTNNYDGEVYIIRDGGLYMWNEARADPLPFKWESKTYETPFPLNFAAFKVKWTVSQRDADYEALDSTAYNAAVYAEGPLHTFNQFAYNNNILSSISDDVRKVYRSDLADTDFYPDVIPMSLGGSDLIPPIVNTLDEGVRVTILARKKNDPQFKTVYSRIVTDEEQHHIKSTFKADLWRFRLESSNNVYSFVIGEKGSELAQV